MASVPSSEEDEDEETVGRNILEAKQSKTRFVSRCESSCEVYKCMHKIEKVGVANSINFPTCLLQNNCLGQFFPSVSILVGPYSHLNTSVLKKEDYFPPVDHISTRLLRFCFCFFF